MDERDLSQERKWFYEERAKIAVKNLQRNNIMAQYVPNRQEALVTIIGMIPPGAVVARGDSISADQVGVNDELRRLGRNRIIDPMERAPDGHPVIKGEERLKAMREVFSADIMITGTNAVTLDGKLVNIDGRGNRVSAMVFGPSKVIIVVGVNKIVKDVEEGLERTRKYAAPMNTMRHFLRHHREEFGDLACVRSGTCVDCKNTWRVCNYILIIEHVIERDKGRINVVLVGEELGI